MPLLKPTVALDRVTDITPELLRSMEVDAILLSRHRDAWRGMEMHGLKAPDRYDAHDGQRRKDYEQVWYC